MPDKVDIDFGPMKLRCASLYPRLSAGLNALMAKEAVDCEGYMRAHAPWQDQTTNARNGLMASAGSQTVAKGSRGAGGKFVKTGTFFAIDLFHTVPYGIWLEIKWSGKYAIIVPTIEAQSPIVMSHVRKLLDRI